MVAAGDPLSGLLIAIGSVAAFMSGLVGVGGAVLLIPMLLYLQPVFGLAAIPIKTVTGMTIVQVAGGALSAGLSHLHAKRVDRSLLIVVGGSLATFSLTGALFSSLVPGIVLEAVFATVALVAAGLMLVLRHRTAPEVEGVLHFNRTLAFVIGAGVGFVAGMLGAGGNFILIPALLYVVRVPLRITIGTSLVDHPADRIAYSCSACIESSPR